MNPQRMSTQSKGLTLLAVQLLLVLSIGAKYAWERHHCPMVWTRAGQYDPAEPLRGRYIALLVHASACGLPPGVDMPGLPRGVRQPPQVMQKFGAQTWRVVPAVRNGQLTPRVVDETQPGPTQELSLGANVPCDDAVLNPVTDLFIPEHAKSPFPLQTGQELWALVTVPPSGPVRPVKLAVSDSQGFHVLNLD
jgi:hypothetical protein